MQSSALSALIASVRLRRSELGQVDAGNRRRLRGVLEPGASRIVDAFDPCVLIQPGQHLRFELGLLGVQHADVALLEFAVAVDHERRRQRRHASKNLGERRRRHRHRVVHLLFRDERFHLVGRHFVFGDAEDDELVAVLVLELDEIRNFSTAWRTPRRPEVDEDDFAAKVGGRDRPAVQIRHREVGERRRVLQELHDDGLTG